MRNESYALQSNSNQKFNDNISRNNKKGRKVHMKKRIRKTISVIAILTMTFQMVMPMVPGVTSKVFATNTTIPVVAENLEEKFKTGEVTQNNQSSEQIDPQEVGTSEKVVTELSESTDIAQTEEISRNYEIKEEETWDVSANGDGSVIAKWTLSDKTLTISGAGEMKDWDNDSVESWHNTQYTNAIEKVIIEEGVTRIGWYAFGGFSSLESIVIPESVTSLGNLAFEGCSSLISINIPEGVTSIGGYAFSGCSSLTSIDIPEGVTRIGDYAFEGCSSLISINIPEGVTSIGEYAFDRCSSLTSINIPEGVTSIDSYEFYGCSSLESIDIPDSVTSIGEDAFYGCSSLESITISESVISIEEDAIPENTIIYTKSNTEAHRYAEENEQGYIIDDIAPTIIFTPNAGENIQKQYSVTVEVQDDMEEVGVNENSLKYQWTQSEQQPTKESFIESFENGQAIIKNTGDGAWYLWIYAEDNVGNETITRSEAFHFDNTAPNVNVEYSTKNPTKENVTVTIISNEEVQAIQGWTLSSDKKTLTKEYTENTTETITIKDLAGNETQVDIKTLPEIMIGDINQDGRIDITDFLMLKRHLVAGNKTNWILTGDSLEAADMNENGIVDITDMLMLKRAVVENM